MHQIAAPESPIGTCAASDSGAAFKWLAWPEQWIRHRGALIRKRRLIGGAVRAGLEPVFVFCHPRVSSKSLKLAIDGTPGLRAVHLHVITERHARWRYGQPVVAGDGVACWGAAPARAAREYMAQATQARFVTAVRDPIAVNISLFLYWGRKHFVRRQWKELLALPTQELASIFMKRCPHQSAVRWFEQEFLPALSLGGMPIEAIGFDPAHGFATIGTPRASALILRSDLPDPTKQAELARFLGKPVAAVERTNESASLFSRELHARLTAVVAQIPGYADRLLETRYVRTFWSEPQRDALRASWARVAEATVAG